MVQEDSVRRCPGCGKSLQADWDSCPACNSPVGHALPSRPEPIEPNSSPEEQTGAGSLPEEETPFAIALGAPDLKFEFVRIEPGEFWMGSAEGEAEAESSEKPRHRVRITRGFELGRYPVTQALWESVMGTNPSRFKGATLPVENVSWEDVQEFLKKLNAGRDGYFYRLPTEAEWEYACRAGTEGARYGLLDAVAWHSFNSESSTHPVGEKQPNGWGLYDMLGNVREWCSDRYGAYSSEMVTDPEGPSSGSLRVLRGGGRCYDGWYCRSASRDRDVPWRRYGNQGLRLARIRC